MDHTLHHYKSLKSYTDEELIEALQVNESIEMIRLAGLCSEILRRMNEIKPLLKDSK